MWKQSINANSSSQHPCEVGKHQFSPILQVGRVRYVELKQLVQVHLEVKTEMRKPAQCSCLDVLYFTFSIGVTVADNLFDTGRWRLQASKPYHCHN